MGEVYLADTRLNRRDAIKFLPADSLTNEQANRRLQREAEAAAKLDHPNICAVHEVAEEDGRSYIVMQYVVGESLDIRMKRKADGVSVSLSIATQIADAHQLGVIYMHIGRLDKAWDEIQKALSIDPTDNLARFRLGSIDIDRGKYEEALAVLKTVPRDADPAIVDARRLLRYFSLAGFRKRQNWLTIT